MKATEARLLDFLEPRKQLVIPIYQRTYSWTRQQCNQLWQDIIRVAEDDDIPAHFIGSVVYIQDGIYHVSSNQQILVIDGQQRLTTISLLLLALANAIDDEEIYEVNRETIFEYYLFNRLMKDDLKYKIMLTQSDKETYISLMEDWDLPREPSQRVINNYHFFVQAIQKSELSIDAIYKGIGKLVIVDVSLDRRYDNPQLIFESLNSTGLDLTQADLIRNYILMGLEPEQQERIYSNHWYQMEKRFGHADYAKLFDRFMRDYLTIKSEAGTIPNLNAVYSEFKRYLQGNEDIEKVVEDVKRFSWYFVRLAFPERNEDPIIRAIMENINTLKVDVAYPLLIEAFDDYERHNLISREEFIEILDLVESYVIRRAIVGIPTNSMNKTFATFKRSIDKNDYLNSLKYAFIQLDSYRRFPRDEEFMREFQIKDIYNLRQRRNYLLSKLENYERKETVNITEYTIEHILPQNKNLPQTWRQELGSEWREIQRRYLHTIGNLTLTGYNSEMSDRTFQEKRDMRGGFADSPLRLNYGLADFDHWGPDQIEDRAKWLAQKAAQIWQFPDLPDEIMEQYQDRLDVEEDGYSLEQFEHLHGEIHDLFEAIQKQILSLDTGVREEPKKYYIAYKTTTNFVDIIPQKTRLRLAINMRFDEIDDPEDRCKDTTGIGRWGNGDVEITVDSFDDIDYAMFLIRQSFEKHTDDVLI